MIRAICYIERGEYYLYREKTGRLLGVFVTEIELLSYCERFNIYLLWGKE